ncbi:MAG: MBG domain-containing protein, partial [Leptospirillum sp.]
VGYNVGTISYSYATGTVSGTGSVGGLVGANSDTISNSYWNTTATATGIGSGSSSTGASGLSAAAFGSSSDFSGWTFNTWSGGKFISSATASPWFMGSVAYGTGTMTAPMLVSDLATATVTGNGTSVYNGSTVTAGYTTTTTMGGTTLSPNVTVTTAAVGPNAGRYTNTPTYTISAPTTQTSVDSVSAVPGTWTIAPATLTATANAASMTYGSSVPALSGTVTGFVDGQTLASDGGTASWTTSATSASKAGIYGITGSVSMNLGNPYIEDYTIIQSPGNSSALTITPGGITSDNFNPVIQTVNLYQKLPALPGISSAGTSSDNPSSPSPSGKLTTLEASQNSSLTVVQPGGDDTSPDGILSVEELKN